MRNHLYRDTRTVTCTLFGAAAGLLAAGPLSAHEALSRVIADFQNTTSGANEISTELSALPDGAGGLEVYTRIAPPIGAGGKVQTVFVTFSAQGDTHNGSALLMNATVNGKLCQPLSGQTSFGGGGTHVQTGWYTLLNQPAPTTSTNCTPANPGDGGGGTGDCHDNTIYFSCCVPAVSDKLPVTVKIKLADLPGGVDTGNKAFYERSTIYVDTVNDTQSEFCKAHGSP